jgi:signal transduction histidine kinase
VSISAVHGHDGERVGRVIVFQDVTPLKRREDALRTREQELDLLRQVQSRVLRHNIRNELTTVRGNAEIIQPVVEGKYERRVRDIIEASDDLLSISAKARVIEDILDEEQAPVEYDLRECVEAAIARTEREHPDLAIELVGPENCEIEAAPQLRTAIENLLENAAVHNTSAEPRVTVTITGGDRPSLTISDNGPGIPEAEVAVIQDGAETSLEHGSGIGLWVVRWIADRSGAELAFETDDTGTDVVLTFQHRLARPPSSTATVRPSLS